ncbi:transporter substrate-binding domain-containing protein [Lysobacter sp. CA199]|uniref:transporter substrate-binding domain-containing protein n=1 Tax=Lysobacter sp. CA199 TaxID=3455608 RepID=UPI003F8D3D0D
MGAIAPAVVVSWRWACAHARERLMGLRCIAMATALALMAGAAAASPTPQESDAAVSTDAEPAQEAAAQTPSPVGVEAVSAPPEPTGPATDPAAAVASGVPAASPRSRDAAPALPKRVRMAVPDWQTLPFTDYNGGQARGFSVELVERILKRRGIQLQFVRTSSTVETLKLLCEGRVDLAANLLLTPQRTRCLVYSDPILQMSMYAVKRKDDARLLSEHNLKRMRLAVPRGMIEHIRDRKRYPQVELIPVDDNVQALRMLEQGQADVFFEAPYVIDWYLRHGDYPHLEMLSTAQLPPTMQQRDMFMLYAAPHAQLALLNFIDEQIKRDPAVLAELRERWLGTDLLNPRPGNELTVAQRE